MIKQAVSALLSLLIAVFVIGLFPASALWSVNQLAGTDISVLNPLNWLAFWVLIVIFDLASGK